MLRREKLAKRMLNKIQRLSSQPRANPLRWLPRTHKSETLADRLRCRPISY